MRTLPLRAQLYIAFMWLLGLGAVAASVLVHGEPSAGPVWQVALFTALAFLAGALKVNVVGHRTPDTEAGSISLGSTIIFVTLLRFGPAAGVCAALASCTASCLYPRRQPTYQILFNLALAAVATWCTGALFVALNSGSLALRSVASFPAIAISSMAFFAINALGVATVIWLAGGIADKVGWLKGLLWSAPTYLACASGMALTCAVSGGSLAAIFLFGAPIAYLIYQSYSMQLVAGAERQRRIEALQKSEAELRESTEAIAGLNERLQRAMAETHHRVKNNLQVVSALIDMQVTSGSDVVPVGELERVGYQVRALATLHELLTQQAKTSGEVAHLSMKDAMERIVPFIQASIGDCRLSWASEDALIPSRQATALAVLVHELTSNAAKHGGDSVEIGLTITNESAVLQVRDNGPGFPADFDPRSHASTGLELVERLARWDLDGETRYENAPDRGAQVTITFPIRPRESVHAVVANERLSGIAAQARSAGESAG